MPIASRIRIAEPEDAAAITRLYVQLTQSAAVHVQAAELARLRNDASTRVLVSVGDAGEVIATALLCFCADVMFGAQPFAVLENIVVDEAYRRANVGSQLLTEIERLCEARDCSKIMLLSSAHRTSAHEFFERQGFTGATKRGFVKYRRQFSAAKHAPDTSRGTSLDT